MKKHKKLAVVILMCCMIFSMSVNAMAAPKYVTLKYRKQVTKMLKGFDNYLGYCFGSGANFKYDVYMRTTMIYYKHLIKLYNKSVNYAERKYASEMKLYFGSKSMKLRKFSGYRNAFKGPSYLIVNRNGKVTYVGGNWGDGKPTGKVTSIIKKGSSYDVLYDMYMYDWSDPTFRRYMGRMRFSLKRVKNKYGFVITNMKRIRTMNLYL